MTYDRLLKDRVALYRARRGISADGDAEENLEPLAVDAACYFDHWESRLQSLPGRIDTTRHARMFLAHDAPEPVPGDRAVVNNETWRVVQTRMVEGATATLRIVELEALALPALHEQQA